MPHFLIPVIAAALMAGVFVPAHFALENKKALRITAKGLATLCPCVLCLIAALQGGHPAAAWTTAGLFVCLAADVLLEIWFYGGMAAFALGHVFYMVAFVKAAPFHLVSALVFGLLAVLLGALFFAWRTKFEGKPIFCFVLYGLVLCAMTAMAFPLSFTLPAPGGVLLAAGAAMFALSDGLLCRNLLLGCSKRQRIVSLYAYYVGQFLLALGWYL